LASEEVELVGDVGGVEGLSGGCGEDEAGVLPDAEDADEGVTRDAEVWGMKEPRR
jgi:hypothetical protein